jgi:hypothetical protein
MPDLEASVCRCAQLSSQQHLIEVSTVERARQEVFARDVPNTARRELQELPRRAGVSRHSVGRDVQQIRMGPIRVRHTAADGPIAFDEHESRGPARRPSQEVRRDHDT